jgi:predicted  nucleic acid-binding Zn-ribbon protein
MTTTKSQCTYCLKSFARVDRHKCKGKPSLIDQLQKEVKDLQDENERLRKALAESETRTTINNITNNNITNNNITNNITLNVIDVKQIERRLLKMLKTKTYKDLLGGLEPYMDIIATSLNPKNQMSYICTDHSRQVFAFKDKSGNIKKEHNGETVFLIEDKVKPAALQALTDRYNYWMDIPEENQLILDMEEMENRIEYLERHQRGYKPTSVEYDRLSVRIAEMSDRLVMKSRQLKSLREKAIDERDRDLEMERLMKARYEIRSIGQDNDMNRKCIRYLSKHPMLNI